jgi:hypothetical protein
MGEPHEGDLELRNGFSAVHHWLQLSGHVELSTQRGLRFSAKATETFRGLRKGEKVIRFYLGTRELARAYECCWGHLANCSGISIDAYCLPLDHVVT